MTPDSPRPTVLIADDDETFRALLRRFLEPAYEVVEVGDGQEALDRVATVRPAVVLTDIIMPRMNGVELLRRLREDPATRTLPVVILLATASNDDVAALRELAAFDILPKERVSRQAVLEKVEAQLRQRRARGMD